jgi:hypothetical protein
MRNIECRGRSGIDKECRGRSGIDKECRGEKRN